MRRVRRKPRTPHPERRHQPHCGFGRLDTSRSQQVTAKRIITADKWTAAHRVHLAQWLVERIADLEIDEEEIDEEYGFHFVAALRGLQQRLKGKAPL